MGPIPNSKVRERAFRTRLDETMMEVFEIVIEALDAKFIDLMIQERKKK